MSDSLEAWQRKSPKERAALIRAYKRQQLANAPHMVYRCYDADDQLIYIGCTSTTIERRMQVHKRSNPPVFEQTVRWTTEQYPDRESALNVEANAIYREKPPLNYRFNPARSRLAGSVRVEITPEEMREAMDRLVATGWGS